MKKKGIGNIVVSGRFLCSDHPTGTHRSSYNLVLGLIKQGVNLRIACPFAPSPVWPIDDVVMERVEVCGSWVRNPHLWEQLFLPLKFRKSVLLYTMGSGSFLFGTSRSAMVLHDINYKLISQSYTLPFRIAYHFVSYLAAKRCRVVLCVSEYTKRRFVERSGCDETKCAVFHQGSGSLSNDDSFDVEDDVVARYENESYFLCVGSLQPHKNFNNAVKGFEGFRNENRTFDHYKLLVVGKAQSGFRSVDVENNNSDIVFLGYLSDSSLLGLYRHACGFVFPSFEEGFGMPIIEAFSQGCPVITSNVSCMPEIAGDAALLVNPANPSDITKAMRECVRDEVRSRLAVLGAARLGTYNWANASQEVAGVLERSDLGTNIVGSLVGGVGA